jgi:hypothetical protein
VQWNILQLPRWLELGGAGLVLSLLVIADSALVEVKEYTVSNAATTDSSTLAEAIVWIKIPKLRK